MKKTARRNVSKSILMAAVILGSLSMLSSVFAAEPADEEEIVITRTKKFAMKPMDPEEACIEMELTGHNFFVFRNSETDEVNVVYKRKGNTYGLIEPEY